MVHLAPLYKQKLKRFKPTVKSIKVWSAESVDALNGCFECTDWDVLLQDSSLDEATGVVSDYINFCVDSVVETKEVKIFPNSKPWITSELRQLLNERQVAFKANDKAKVKQLQKRIDHKVRAEKRKYAVKLEDNLRTCNSRQYWQNISTITGYKAKSADLQSEDAEKLANELNVFYTRFDKHDFQQEQQQALARVRDREGIPIPVSEDDIRGLFRSLNARSAAGPDRLSSKTLKLCSDSLSAVFTGLIQRSFQEGYVPRLWRTSTIIPVPKKKAPTQMNDFRPVALTSVVMKCAERVVLKHLRQETAEQQDPLQFAYCKGRNTEDAILTLLHSLYSHLDKPRTYARILYVDFSSAFNTLQPHLLVEKLLAMSVNPTLIMWVHSFMTDRPQQVRVGNAVSDVLATNTGAPQGCVLSPALFTTYTADCRSQDQSNVLVKFADDTSLSGLVSSDESSYRSAVTELVDWCDKNFLELNINKTEEMVIDFRRQSGIIDPLVIKGEEVRIVSQYKYLGTVIDDKLDWSANVDACCKKTNQRLFFLRKLKQFRVSSTILTMFYQSVIESMLLYNQLCYFNGITQADRDRLNRLVSTASKVTGREARPLALAYDTAAVKKIRRIQEEPSHPLHQAVAACESRRSSGRLISLKCRTSRFKDSFLPTAIRTVNEANTR